MPHHGLQTDRLSAAQAIYQKNKNNLIAIITFPRIYAWS